MKRVKLVPHDSTDSRESIELDEYSDEEDEVFLKNSRNGKDNSASRPLMKKRRRKKNGDVQAAIRTSNPKYRRCCGPFCWLFLAFKTVIGAMIITVVLVNYFTHEDWYFWHWAYGGLDPAPCHRIEVIPVWSQRFPKFLSEGSFRMVNVSNDDVLDVVFGYGTGGDGFNVPDIVCDVYFGGEKPCFGGVMALNGKDGSVLWRRPTDHEIFSINCQEDLSGDGKVDCVAGGRVGVFLAINGQNGEVLWNFEKHPIQTEMLSMYAAQIVHDLDGDGTPDVLAVHGGDKLSDPAERIEDKLFGRMMLLSGKTGKLLRWMPTPDRRGSFYPPQILTGRDGEQFVLFGTGTNRKGGSLYVISLFDLYKQKISKAFPIFRDDEKGMITPAALVDINLDGQEDIVISTFDSVVIAIDGQTFTQIWNETFESSETYSSVSVGYFDNDNIPDFFVKYNRGSHPVYQYEMSVVLSGKNGSRLTEPMINSIGSESSPLVVSVEGLGNDLFLHWSSNCLGKPGRKLNYTFPETAKNHDMSQADLCQQLFRVNQVARFEAFQRFNFSNPFTIYNSIDADEYEHSNMTKTSETAATYVKMHPELLDKYASNDEYSVIPYDSGDLDDFSKELEQFYDSDMEFVPNEGLQDLPFKVAEKPPELSGEQVPALIYPKPHKVEKNRPEIEGQDAYEYPYAYPKSRRSSWNIRRKRQTKKANSPLHWGIFGLASTGTLAPPLLRGNQDSIDLILATHWLYPARVPVMQKEDVECVQKALGSRQDVTDEEIFEALYDKALEKCLKASGHIPPADETYETPSEYNPLAVNMGQLTVYRYTLRCVCTKDNLRFGQTCAKVLPYEAQGWPAFMGIRGDSRFNSAPRTKK